METATASMASSSNQRSETFRILADLCFAAECVCYAVHLFFGPYFFKKVVNISLLHPNLRVILVGSWFNSYNVVGLWDASLLRIPAYVRKLTSFTDEADC